MSHSSKAGKGWTIQWVTENQNKIKEVLDLGCGSGTYSTLFREKYPVLKNSNWTGIEIWEPYLEKYNLRSKYNQVILGDLRTISYDQLGLFDLCFLGDVLEHMEKEDSIKVVNAVLNISKRIIISIPIVHFPGGESEGNPYQEHVKDDWSDEEVRETFPHILDGFREKKIGVYLLGKKEF